MFPFIMLLEISQAKDIQGCAICIEDDAVSRKEDDPTWNCLKYRPNLFFRVLAGPLRPFFHAVISRRLIMIPRFSHVGDGRGEFEEIRCDSCYPRCVASR